MFRRLVKAMTQSRNLKIRLKSLLSHPIQLISKMFLMELSLRAFMEPQSSPINYWMMLKLEMEKTLMRFLLKIVLYGYKRLWMNRLGKVLLLIVQNNWYYHTKKAIMIPKCRLIWLMILLMFQQRKKLENWSIIFLIKIKFLIFPNLRRWWNI